MITVYSKPSCQFCDMAKALLTKHAIEFQVVDVTMDAQAMKFLVDGGFKSVPQLFKDGELFVSGGYQGLVKLIEAGELQ